MAPEGESPSWLGENGQQKAGTGSWVITFQPHTASGENKQETGQDIDLQILPQVALFLQ